MLKILITIFDKQSFFILLVAFGFFVLGSILFSSIPFAFKLVIDHLDSGFNYALITISIYSAVFFFSNICGSLKLVTYIYFEQKIQKKLALLVLDKCFHTPFKTLLLNRSDEYSICIDRGLSGLRDSLYGVFFNVLPTMVQLLFFLYVYLTKSDWKSSLSIILLVAVFLVIAIKYSKLMKARWETSWGIATRNYGIMNETITNIESIRNYSAVGWAQKRYAHCQDDFIHNIQKMVPTILSMGVLQSLVLIMIVGTVSFISIHNYNVHKISLGDVVMINSLLIQMIAMLQSFSSSYQGLLTSASSLAQLSVIMENGSSSINIPMHFHEDSAIASKRSINHRFTGYLLI